MSGIKSIYIETFRGIRNLKLENLAPINILTGDNNCGKTSILEVLQSLKLIDSFRVWRDLLRTGMYFYRGFSYYEGFYDLFDINLEDKKIKYKVQLEEDNIDVLICAQESEEEIDVNEKEEILGTSNMIHENNSEFERTELLSRLDLGLFINGEEKDNLKLYEGQRRFPLNRMTPDRSSLAYNVVYISPVRHAEGVLFLNNVLNDPELYEEMIEILKEYDEGIISINYDTQSEARFSRGIYKILSKSTKKALPLNVYGDGMKKAILLMSAVVKAKDGILLLDEFETAIHTSAMNKTFRWILKTCRKLNVQVFLTSHSQEAIDKVLKCDSEIQKDIALYTLYKEQEETFVRRLSGKEAVEAQDNMGLELR
ncbi:AAA family ATPase [Anaerobutyricum soehngenii]|uniref:AAA family ATPase n=1 Tax=Anaerobutyricum soehngenii TaxID=105843 RepID=UPI003D79F876